LNKFRACNPYSPKRKNFKGPQYPELDEQLKNWVFDQRLAQRIINTNVIREKAKEIFANLSNQEKFKSYAGYVNKFCKRYAFRMAKQHGESNSADKEGDENLCRGFFQE